MKMRSWPGILLLVLTGCLLFPGQVLACACCSGEGDYHISFSKPEEYYLSLMKEIRFGPTAKLVTSEAGMDHDAQGLANPAEAYSITGSFVDNLWKLSFRSRNRSGTLTLPLAEKMWDHVADIHDGKLSGGGGPLLYKEWRFEGPVKGTGIFRDGIGDETNYFLVLQGRGNGCHNAEDFKHWRLAVTGKKARYAFYGRLARPTTTARKVEDVPITTR